MNLIGPVVSDEMFENVDERTDAGVTGILLAFGSGELKSSEMNLNICSRHFLDKKYWREKANRLTVTNYNVVNFKTTLNQL